MMNSLVIDGYTVEYKQVEDGFNCWLLGVGGLDNVWSFGTDTQEEIEQEAQKRINEHRQREAAWREPIRD